MYLLVSFSDVYWLNIWIIVLSLTMACTRPVFSDAKQVLQIFCITFLQSRNPTQMNTARHNIINLLVEAKMHKWHIGKDSLGPLGWSTQRWAKTDRDWANTNDIASLILLLYSLFLFNVQNGEALMVTICSQNTPIHDFCFIFPMSIDYCHQCGP